MTKFILIAVIAFDLFCLLSVLESELKKRKDDDKRQEQPKGE